MFAARLCPKHIKTVVASRRRGINYPPPGFCADLGLDFANADADSRGKR